MGAPVPVARIAMLPTALIAATPLAVPGLLLLRPAAMMDRQGWISVIADEAALGAVGVHDRFIRDTIIYAEHAGSVRGLHYQLAPRRQARIVRVLRGRAYVVAVDVRRGSATFGRSGAAALSYMDGAQVYAMPGFALGWCSLDPATELLVKSSAVDDPELQRGINWRDPALKLDWPVRAADAHIEVEDVGLPMLADQPDLPD